MKKNYLVGGMGSEGHILVLVELLEMLLLFKKKKKGGGWKEDFFFFISNLVRETRTQAAHLKCLERLDSSPTALRPPIRSFIHEASLPGLVIEVRVLFSRNYVVQTSLVLFSSSWLAHVPFELSADS